MVRLSIALASLLPLMLVGCDDARKQECDKLLTAMKPVEQGTPAADAVDSVSKQIEAMKFQDQPLGVYAKNYRDKLTVLSSTLKLKATGSAPDGTDDLIKKNLKDTHTDYEDVKRYCSQ